jgi:integrase
MQSKVSIKPFSPARFQVARREEVALVAWSAIDEEARVWHIPSERAKNTKARLVHLSDPTWPIIKERPRHSSFVFASSRGKNFQMFKVFKAALDLW